MKKCILVVSYYLKLCKSYMLLRLITAYFPLKCNMYGSFTQRTKENNWDTQPYTANTVVKPMKNLNISFFILDFDLNRKERNLRQFQIFWIVSFYAQTDYFISYLKYIFSKYIYSDCNICFSIYHSTAF